MDDLKMEGLKGPQTKKAARTLFPYDVLFGNWQPDDATYAVNAEGHIVRLCQDRALGCTYPEDRAKGDKLIIEFSHDNIEATKRGLREGHRWLFGQMTGRKFLQSPMGTRLTEKKHFYRLMRALDISEGLPWEGSVNLSFIMESRIKSFLFSLPHHDHR